MGPIFASAVVDAPRERIFELLSDLSCRPAFCDHFMLDYRLERLDASGVGAAARFRIEAPRNHHWADSGIEAVEAPRMVRERGRGGRMNRVPTHTVWEIREGMGSGSTVDVAFWTQPQGILDRLREKLGAQRWYRRQLKRALARLGQAAEGKRSDVARVAVGGG